MRAGEVGWQQHKMSVRLGSGPGSNMHIITMHVWLAASLVSGTSFVYCPRNPISSVEPVQGNVRSSQTTRCPCLYFARLDLTRRSGLSEGQKTLGQ